jgi:integrase
MSAPEVAYEEFEAEDDIRIIVRPMLTTSQATDLFLGDLGLQAYSPRTISTYRRVLYKFCDRLPDDQDITKVSPDDCRRFLNLSNHLAAGTRGHTYSVLSSFFSWLYHTEKIKRNPLDRIERPKRVPADDLDVVTVSGNEVRVLLEAAQGWTEKLSVAIPAYMGARRHAVATLRLSDYDQERGRIRFKEKGGKVIWKPVPDDLARLLNTAIADGAITKLEDYLVPPAGGLVRKGERDDRVIWRAVNNVAKGTGVKCHVHSLRAAFAVFYLEQNPGDLEALKELMGHSSLTTTQIYLRKLNKGVAMERVRSLSWGTSTMPERAAAEVGESGRAVNPVPRAESVRIARRPSENTLASQPHDETKVLEPPLRDPRLSMRSGTQHRDGDRA